MDREEMVSIVGNTEFRINRYRNRLSNGNLSSNEMLELIEMYRCVACGHYLIDSNKESFVQNTYHGIQTYILLQQKVQMEALPAHFCWWGNAHLWFDIISINAIEKGKTLFSLMNPACCDQDGEIMENHYYFRLLGGMFLSTFSSNEMQRLVYRFEHEASKIGIIRLGVLKAIFEKDPEKFTKYLKTLLKSWNGENIERHQKGRIHPYFFYTTGTICLEGLALVKLANQKGLGLHGKFPFIPIELV